MIPFIDLKSQYNLLKQDIDLGIQGVLEHGQYIMGPEVNELEQALASYVNSKYCITVSSGTEALLISLMAIGVKSGDEIITTPFTFVATAEVIALLGATPIFVDIDPETCNLNINLVEQVITSKTKAIIPVSLYGQVSDMDELNQIAERHNIVVIEDAAQSFGAEYKGKKSCNLSAIGCTSFFPSKPLGCYGDGGAIFTNDQDLAKIMREIRVHGQEQRYCHTRIGVGGRMDTLQCAVVLAKLKVFEEEINKRIEIGNRYNQAFRSAGIQTITVKPDRTSVYGQYTIRVKNERSRVQNKLQSLGVPTAIHYPIPLHLQSAYRSSSYDESSFPESLIASQEVMSLPMHPYLDEPQQDTVINAVVSSICKE